MAGSGSGVDGAGEPPVIDFARSFVTFFTKPHQGGNIARILIDAACTITGERTGTARTFYLIAPCRSEQMYVDAPLFQMPNYEFCGVFTDDEVMIVRTHWTSDRDNREIASATERFAKVDITVQHLPHPEALTDDAQAVAATLANRPLVARTELQNEARGRRALLDYPIKTMNVTRDPARLQVDTGPLLYPNLDATAEPAIARFEIAHVVYHQRDRAEFILRRPTPVGDEGAALAVTDYSDVRLVPARNTLFAGT